MKRRCPVCRKVIDAAALRQGRKEKLAPFCSQRCKMIDLGRWLDSDYKIITELKPEDPANAAGRTQQPEQKTSGKNDS